LHYVTICVFADKLTAVATSIHCVVSPIKKENIKIPFSFLRVLCCETWRLTLREEHIPTKDNLEHWGECLYQRGRK
jgi:hypothetical protein